MEFRKDLYHIVDSLNKRIPKEKIEAINHDTKHDAD
jgi:hypothetical protein